MLAHSTVLINGDDEIVLDIGLHRHQVHAVIGKIVVGLHFVFVEKAHECPELCRVSMDEDRIYSRMCRSVNIWENGRKWVLK